MPSLPAGLLPDASSHFTAVLAIAGSSGERLGQFVGGLLGYLLLLAGFIWFVTKFIKIVWVRVLLILLFFSFLGLVKLAEVSSRAVSSRVREKAGFAALLQAPLEPQRGVYYTIGIPNAAQWKISRPAPFDQVFHRRPLFVGIIAEEEGGELQPVLKAIQEMRKEAFPDCRFSEAREVALNGLPWHTFDMHATARGIEARTRYFVYVDAKKAVQLMFTADEASFVQAQPLIERIAESFQFDPAP